MSGGSFNYLCFANDVEELLAKRSDLEQMAAQLTSFGYKDAALETESILAYLEHVERQVQARLVRLQDVWKAVEWKCSGDYSLDQVEEAIKKYRGA